MGIPRWSGYEWCEPEEFFIRDFKPSANAKKQLAAAIIVLSAYSVVCNVLLRIDLDDVDCHYFRTRATTSCRSNEFVWQQSPRLRPWAGRRESSVLKRLC